MATNQPIDTEHAIKVLTEEEKLLQEYRRKFGRYKPNLDKIDTILDFNAYDILSNNVPPPRRLKSRKDWVYKATRAYYTQCDSCGKPTLSGHKYCLDCSRPEYATKSCCKILKHHAIQLQHDPERLTTDFIKKLSKCKCDKEGDSK